MVRQQANLLLNSIAVNAQERKALKRALVSKEKWKDKAKERQKGMRLLELKIRDIERSRINWKEKFLLEKESKNNKKSKRSESSIESVKQMKSDRKKN